MALSENGKQFSDGVCLASMMAWVYSLAPHLPRKYLSTQYSAVIKFYSSYLYTMISTLITLLWNFKN